MAVVFLIVFLFNGVSVNASEKFDEKTAEKFLKEVIDAYQDQSTEKLAEYYGLNDIEESAVAFEQALFQSFEAKTVRVGEMEYLLEEGEYLYVGVELEFLLKDGNKIPYYEYFLLRKEDIDEYIAVPEGAYPIQIEKAISKNQERWQQTELYRDYQNAEKQYEENLPGHREEVYERLSMLLNNVFSEMENNLRMAGMIFIMGIVQLLMLCIWILYKDKYYD